MLIAPRAFIEVGRGSAAGGEQSCLVRRFFSDLGEDVVFWSCTAINPYRSVEEEFESNVEKYATISRTETRAVVTYTTGEFKGYCVLRLDGTQRNDVCSMSLSVALEFESQYFTNV